MHPPWNWHGSDLIRFLLDLSALVGLLLAFRSRHRFRPWLPALFPAGAAGLVGTAMFLALRGVDLFLFANLIASSLLIYLPAGLLLTALARTDLGRRARFGVAVAGLGLGAVAIDVWLIEPNRLQVSRLVVAADNWPAGTHLRILHLSDPQMERMEAVHRQVLARVAELKPEVIVVTGDWAQHRAAIADCREFAAGLRAPLGVYTVTGDCEGWLPWAFPGAGPRLADSLRALVGDAGIRVLDNETAMVTLPDGARLEILGIDRLAPDPALLTEPSDSRAFRLLLTHSPDIVLHPDVPRANAFILAGHTHGGQIRLPWLGPVATMTELGRDYGSGLFIIRGTKVFVSRGIGCERGNAPRIRFNCPPEITVIEIRGAGA